MSNDLDNFIEKAQSHFNVVAEEKYGPVVAARWKNPTHIGQMKDADAMGEINREPGGHLKLFLRIKDDRIEKASFYTTGCGPGIVCADLVCEVAEGKTLQEAAGITGAQLLARLEGMPENKAYYTEMAADALQETLKSVTA